MRTVHVNGIDIHHEVEGSGDPIVLVHGNWSDHTSVGLLAAELRRDFRVLTYDRRGHGRTELPRDTTLRSENEDDLIALIEMVVGEAAHVVGNSYGGLVSLGVAGRRPELVKSLSVHEPPAVTLPAEGELAATFAGVHAVLRGVAEEIETGDRENAIRRFMEEGALGEGAWALIPGEMKELFRATAAAFVAEVRDPGFSVLDLEEVNRYPGPVLLTEGEGSPGWLPAIVRRLAELVPSARRAVVPGAGHAPHETHPDVYAAILAEFAGPARLRAAA